MRSIGGGTGRGIILSQLHSWTQGDKGGTYQGQNTLKRYGDLKRSMEEEGQVLGIGGFICGYWGIMRKEETQSIIAGGTGHHI